MKKTLLGFSSIFLSAALTAQGGRLLPMNLVQAGDTVLDVLILQTKTPPTLEVTRVAASGNPTVAMYPTSSEHARIHLNPALARDEFISVRLVGSTDPELETYARLYSGDANGSHSVDIADATAILDHLFGGGADPFFPTYADVNGNGVVEIADAVYLLDYLFSGGPEPIPIDSGLGLCAPGDHSSSCVQALIAAMGNPDNPHVADYAYLRLFDIGDAAVPALLSAATATSSSQAYPGRACINRFTSIDGPGRVRLLSAYLLLIESARRGDPAPFLQFEFLSTGFATASSQELAVALADFTAWDASNAGVPLTQRLRPSLSSPLQFSAQAQNTITLTSDLGWVIPGSGQPDIDDATFCIAGENPGEFIWFFEGGPFSSPTVAYNCFAWAAGCQNDRWVENGPDDDHDTFLRERLGLDPTAPASGPTGTPGEVMITYHRCPNGMSTPVHATKRDGNKWQAKMGIGPLVRGICNPEGLAELAYPAEPPKTVVHVYYPPLF